jgi:hypothetical protein
MDAVTGAGAVVIVGKLGSICGAENQPAFMRLPIYDAAKLTICELTD